MANPKSRENKLYLIPITSTILMVLSLRWRFLDMFVPGTWHGRIGLDFFCLPRGFINLVHHKSVFNTDFSQYGPYATWYTYHPILPIVFGSWLSLFKPWTAYGIFVGLSVIILWWCSRLLEAHTKSTFLKATIYGLFFCSPATYLMLWNAQVHILTVLGVTLVLVSLFDMKIEIQKKKLVAGKVNKKMLWGLLISLFSKPIVLLAAPILLITKETRITTTISLVIYLLVSWLFLVVPFLNPESVPIQTWFSSEVLSGNNFRPFTIYDNLNHWANMVYQSGVISTPKNGYYHELFSLPTYMQFMLGFNLPPVIFKIPILIVAVFALLSFSIGSPIQRLRYVLLVVCLTICSFYLSYNLVWEYQYTTLIPVIGVMIILIKSKQINIPGFLARLFLASAMLLYTPTCLFMFTNRLDSGLTACRSMRVIPTVMLFAIVAYATVGEVYYRKKTA